MKNDNDIEDILNLEEHSEDDEKTIKKELFIKKIIQFVIIFLLFVFSIIFNKRITVFSIMFFGNKIIGNILYYTFISIEFIILTGYLLFFILKIKNKINYKLLHKFHKIFDLPQFILAAAITILFFMVFITTPFTVSGDSMNYTLTDGDRVICTDLFYKPKKEDIVVFDAYNYTEQSLLYIKRVVAVEGDVLSYKDGALLVNNEHVEYVSSRQYLKIIGRTSDRYLDDFTVQKGYVVVLGDNRLESYDSRYFGMVNEKDILGHVLFRLYPFKKIEKILG
ncbi:MAG: signal peptidase I [Anaeroplasma sp.]|nr:signal peptidase I [Anaeroplasma sp.]